MKPEKLPSWESLAKGLQILFSDTSPELLVLKMHLMTEAHLYRLLSFRLEMEEEHLPPLQFFPLAKLALGGDSYKGTLVKILALNDLRNEFSHELDEGNLDPAFAKFCGKIGVFWPPFDISNNPASFAEIRKGAIGTAAATCVTEVWQQFARLVAAKRREAALDDSEILKVVAESERIIKELIAQQNTLKSKFSANAAATT